MIIDARKRSDHVMICFEYLCMTITVPSSSNRKYLFGNGTYDQFNLDLISLDWNDMFNGLVVKEMWNFFHSIYNKLLDKYIPSVVVSANKVLPLWMNKFVKTN